ncbi:MAG: hypothetical protein KJO11_03830 [Gemmatimonadetes bacterium]|nr:hypothetical protein [Gemmatimonadota bacterium]
MNRPTRTALLLLALTGAACAAPTQGSPFGAGPQGERTIRIEVRNLNFSDATLHALRGSERVRLGIVTGKVDRSFDIDWTISLPLQIEIDLLAGERCTTRPINVDPGDVIVLQIESDLRRSGDCLAPGASPP